MTLFIFSRKASAKRRLVWLMVLALYGCEIPPEVHVQPNNPPTFAFSRGTLVDMLLVYHLRPEQARTGIFLDALLKDKANISWMVEGKHDQQVPITYGTVPIGMRESAPAQPLAEGDYYMVYVGSGVSARFVITNGIPQEYK